MLGRTEQEVVARPGIPGGRWQGMPIYVLTTSSYRLHSIVSCSPAAILNEEDGYYILSQTSHPKWASAKPRIRSHYFRKIWIMKNQKVHK